MLNTVQHPDLSTNERKIKTRNEQKSVGLITTLDNHAENLDSSDGDYHRLKMQRANKVKPKSATA